MNVLGVNRRIVVHVKHARACGSLEVVDARNSAADTENAMP